MKPNYKPTRDDLVVRYIKHLIWKTLLLNNMGYLGAGLGCLLYKYSPKQISHLAFLGSDDLRAVKMRVTRQMNKRFFYSEVVNQSNTIRRAPATAYDHSLVMNTLRTFVPWGSHHISIASTELSLYEELCSENVSDWDRKHALIDPECGGLERLVMELNEYFGQYREYSRLPDPARMLFIPAFNGSPTPPQNRFKCRELTETELMLLIQHHEPSRCWDHDVDEMLDELETSFGGDCGLNVEPQLNEIEVRQFGYGKVNMMSETFSGLQNVGVGTVSGRKTDKNFSRRSFIKAAATVAAVSATIPKLCGGSGSMTEVSTIDYEPNKDTSFAFDLEALDSDVLIPLPAPSPSTTQKATEMVEHYWTALLRDVPFTEYGGNPTLANAVADLNSRSFQGHANQWARPVLAQYVFCGHGSVGNVDVKGPYVSELMIQSILFGAQPFSQMYQTSLPSQPLLSCVNSYQSVENETRMYALHQDYFVACSLLANQSGPLYEDDPGLLIHGLKVGDEKQRTVFHFLVESLMPQEELCALWKDRLFSAGLSYPGEVWYQRLYYLPNGWGSQYEGWLNLSLSGLPTRFRNQILPIRVIDKHRKRETLTMIATAKLKEGLNYANVPAHVEERFGDEFQRGKWILIKTSSYAARWKPAQFLVEGMWGWNYYDRERAKEILDSMREVDKENCKQPFRIEPWLLPKQSSEANCLAW